MTNWEFRQQFDQRLALYASLKMSKKEFYKYAIDTNYAETYIKELTKINKAEKMRSKIVQDRKLEVVYFTGKSGSGKTTAAKYFAEQKHYDYFVSGSGDDPLDGYDLEECLILDDFRAGTMRFQELLKFLDNNTESSVKSRYYNKTLSNCRLIIITSINEPDELYNFFKEDGPSEPIEQFYRRLKHRYFKVEDNQDIAEYLLKVDQPQEKTGRILGNMADIYEQLGIDTNTVDDSSILDEFLQTKETKLIDKEALRGLI